LCTKPRFQKEKGKKRRKREKKTWVGILKASLASVGGSVACVRDTVALGYWASKLGPNLERLVECRGWGSTWEGKLQSSLQVCTYWL
jgi:hypothetical protein